MYKQSNYAGERYLTASMHGLMHLPEVVQHLGPLWAHSCFPFEAANGELKVLFHGSRAVEKQVHIALSTRRISSCILPETQAFNDHTVHVNHSGVKDMLS